MDDAELRPLLDALQNTVHAVQQKQTALNARFDRLQSKVYDTLARVHQIEFELEKEN